jgi:hypothetical protein
MSRSGQSVSVRAASILEEGEIPDDVCSGILTFGPTIDQTVSVVGVREQETLISEASGEQKSVPEARKIVVEDINFTNLRNRAAKARRKENRFAKRIQKVAEAVSERAEDRAVIRSLISVNKQLVTANKEQAKAHEAGLTRVLDQSDAHSAEVTRLRTELASLEKSYRNSASSSSEEDKAKEKLISDLRSQLAEVTKRQLSLHVEVCSLKKVVNSVLPAASAAEHQGLKKGSSLSFDQIKSWIPDPNQSISDDHVHTDVAKRSSSQDHN